VATALVKWRAFSKIISVIKNIMEYKLNDTYMLHLYFVFSAGEKFDENMLEIFKINIVLSGIIMSGSDGFG